MYEVVPGAVPREMGGLEQAPSRTGTSMKDHCFSVDTCVQSSPVNDVQDSPMIPGFAGWFCKKWLGGV